MLEPSKYEIHVLWNIFVEFDDFGICPLFAITDGGISSLNTYNICTLYGEVFFFESENKIVLLHSCLFNLYMYMYKEREVIIHLKCLLFLIFTIIGKWR